MVDKVFKSDLRVDCIAAAADPHIRGVETKFVNWVALDTPVRVRYIDHTGMLPNIITDGDTYTGSFGSVNKPLLSEVDPAGYVRKALAEKIMGHTHKPTPPSPPGTLENADMAEYVRKALAALAAGDAHEPTPPPPSPSGTLPGAIIPVGMWETGVGAALTGARTVTVMRPFIVVDLVGKAIPCKSRKVASRLPLARCPLAPIATMSCPGSRLTLQRTGSA